MTKKQYELLEGFALNRIHNMDLRVEDLREACRAAVLILPFKSIQGMEEFADDDASQNISDLLAKSRTKKQPWQGEDDDDDDQPEMTLDNILDTCAVERLPGKS